MKRIAVCVCLLIFVASAFCDTVHTVQPGETVYGIARKYGVAADDILRDNGMDAASATRLRAGTKLTIRGVQAPEATQDAPPAYALHTVRDGENLYRIALLYGTTVQVIEELNPGIKPGRLSVGAKVKVPAPPAGRAATAAAPATPKSGTAPAATETSGAAGAAPSGAASAKTPAARSQEGLWPHSGPRVALTDPALHFKPWKVSGKAGDPVVAVASGRVTWVSPYLGYRNFVIIEARIAQIRESYQFVYAGVENVYVRAGEWVEKGATVARMGADGGDGKGQVLFAVYQGAQLVDHTLLSWQ